MLEKQLFKHWNFAAENVPKTTAVMGTDAAAIPSIGVLGENTPSKRIRLGCIGMGGQGVNRILILIRDRPFLY